MDIYQEHGFENRQEYLKSLTMEHDVDLGFVLSVAELLGPHEDFDGLVNSIDDYADDL